jgi:hypothetical protein
MSGMNIDTEQFITATFNTAELVSSGLDKIEKGDVVTLSDQLLAVRGREDRWSLESGMTTVLTFTHYEPFPYS